jgi:hypothetical protein
MDHINYPGSNNNQEEENLAVIGKSGKSKNVKNFVTFLRVLRL